MRGGYEARISIAILEIPTSVTRIQFSPDEKQAIYQVSERLQDLGDLTPKHTLLQARATMS